MNGNKPIAEGIITEALPNAMFRITLDNEENIIGYVSGKMKINRIRLDPGDRVKVEMDPYKGKATNRIVRRL